jgi:hypothetical protein
MEHKSKLLLPPDIVGAVDVKRLIRELDYIDDSFLQFKLRHKDNSAKLPTTSILLDLIVSENNFNLLHETHRKELNNFLKSIREDAPMIHMSFSANPSNKFLKRLMEWLRAELHPQILLTVGLEPNIGAGCILRTNNKLFDMSLKQDFYNSRAELISKMIPPPIVPQNSPSNQEALAP